MSNLKTQTEHFIEKVQEYEKDNEKHKTGVACDACRRELYRIKSIPLSEPAKMIVLCPYCDKTSTILE